MPQGKSFILQMVTPDQIIYQQAVEKLVISTTTGEITVLADHTPLVAAIRPGEVAITEVSAEKNSSKIRTMAVSEGVIEVKDNFVKLLVQIAERIEELDHAKIEKAKKAAEEMIEKAKKAGIDERGFAVLETSLQREIAKLKILERHKNKRR